MKIKTILSVAIVSSSCLFAKAQDGTSLTPDLASTSVGRVIQAIQNSPDIIPETNVTFIVYASHAKGLKDNNGKDASWGGGIAIVYPLNENVTAAWRIQYLAGNVYSTALTGTLKTSKKIGPLTMTPFVYAGPSLPVGGTEGNGSLYLVYGIGASLSYRISDSTDIGLTYALEYNPGLNVNRIEHFGPKWTRHF